MNTSPNRCKQTKNDLLTGIRNEITDLLDKCPLGKHSACVSHCEEGQNIECNIREQTEKKKKSESFDRMNSHENLIPPISLIDLYRVYMKEKGVIYISAFTL